MSGSGSAQRSSAAAWARNMITGLTSVGEVETGAVSAGTDYVYVVDGIHPKVRLEQEKLCLLAMIGVL